ncbi:MAG: hypothetical protein ACI9OH_002084 [Oleispira sp.]|jgi:hypothetical protein
MMKLKIFLIPVLLSSVISQAELAAMADIEMESISGKGIRIDANVDFARDTTVSYDSATPWGNNASDDNYFAYRRILVDNSGTLLSDSNNDGFIDNGTSNIRKENIFNGYNVKYKSAAPNDADYLIRNPYYVIVGEISGGISFSGLELEFVSDFGSDSNKAALKWTLPEEIVFDNFEISGIYVSDDLTIDRNDNKIIGARIDGPVYMPSATNAYVFVTSD